jgi:hypothetical protein
MIAAATVLQHGTHTPDRPAARATVKALRPHFRPDNALVDYYLDRIGPIGFTLYSVLLRHADRKTGVCWPSLATIARKMHVSRPTIIKYLRLLVKEGLIEFTERFGPSGRQTSHRYIVHPAIPDAPPAAPEAPGEGKADLPPPAQEPAARGKPVLPLEQVLSEQATPPIFLSALKKQPRPLLQIIEHDRTSSPAYAKWQAKTQGCPHSLAVRFQAHDGYQRCRHCGFDQFPALIEGSQPAPPEASYD